MHLRISWSLAAWQRVLNRLPSKSDVALTIDDGPMPETTLGLLDLLDRFGVKATFFLSGCRLEGQEDVVRDIIARGHGVYAHGWEHIRLDAVESDRLIADMERCERILAQWRPTPSPYLVRLPYNAGWRNRGVHRALARWQPGCQIVHWSLSTEDHLISPRCVQPDDVERECQAEVKRVLADSRLPGGILLMHDQPINDRPGAEFKAQTTLTLMRLLLEGLQAAHYQLVPVVPSPPQPLWARFAMLW